MPSAFLEDRGVVRVGGEDARAFLQGLFTCDLTKVAPERAAFGALLTPQGKIIVDFILREDDGAFLIDCPAMLAADLAKRLRFYKLRAKVDVSDLSASHGVVAHWGAGAAGIADPRDSALGGREIVAPRPVPDAGAGADYEALRISLGIPTSGVDFALGDAFPHEANMDLLRGVDFAKGCYVGQEVVSRVEHRGSARKRIARATFSGDPPAPGATIAAGDVEIGTLTSLAGNVGLATVRVDRAREAMDAGVAFTADGRALTLALPEKRR